MRRCTCNDIRSCLTYHGTTWRSIMASVFRSNLDLIVNELVQTKNVAAFHWRWFNLLCVRNHMTDGCVSSVAPIIVTDCLGAETFRSCTSHMSTWASSASNMNALVGWFHQTCCISDMPILFIDEFHLKQGIGGSHNVRNCSNSIIFWLSITMVCK